MIFTAIFYHCLFADCERSPVCGGRAGHCRVHGCSARHVVYSATAGCGLAVRGSGISLLVILLSRARAFIVMANETSAHRSVPESSSAAGVGMATDQLLACARV